MDVKDDSPSCHWRGCEAKQAWRPIVVFESDQGKVAPLELELRLCGPHAYRLEPDDVLSDAVWEDIMEQGFDAKKLPRPDRSKTRLVIQRI